MKTIIELFKDGVSKIIVGIIAFLFAYQTNVGFEQDKDEVEFHETEISFEKKFLEMKSIYFNDLSVD